MLNSRLPSSCRRPIGLEREIRQKSAGLRTYTLVGFSSAFVMLVSKYGFTDVLESGRVVLDPSRIAAQIVSGIGFISGGLIFVRKDIVRGLTTAATVWLTAAVGMACGAGLPILAIAVTFGHFVVVFVFPSIERRLPKSRWAPSSLQISYQDGRGVLREVFACCTRDEFAVSRVEVERLTGISDPHSVNELARRGGRALGKFRHDRLQLRVSDERNRLLRIDPLNHALSKFRPGRALSSHQQGEDLDLVFRVRAILACGLFVPENADRASADLPPDARFLESLARGRLRR